MPKELPLVQFEDLKVKRSNAPDPEAERARRERLREAAGGITSYAVDDVGSIVAFTVSGDVYALNTLRPEVLRFRHIGDATNLEVSPSGAMLSFVAGRELFISRLSENEIEEPTRISPPASETVSWGLSEFIAAEEMQRHEGYWWSPNSNSIVFAGVDESKVPIWHISNPTYPSQAPRQIRYPHAGAQNAEVSLFIWTREVGSFRKIDWDNQTYPYVVAVRWNRDEPTIIVQDRTQKRVVILSVDEVTGQTTIVYTKSDDTWVELIPGLPTWTSDGKLLDAPDAEVRRLQLDGREVTGADLEIRKFIGETSSGGLVYLASSDPRETHVWISDGRNDTKLSDFPGVFDASVGGQTVAVFGSSIGDYPLLAECVSTSADFRRYTLRSNSAKVSIAPCPQFFRTELRGINYALLVPKGFKGDRVLPILMDPYGGPLVQRCIKSTLSFTTSQWFADQGFAVLVGDGRGTPGRGRGWEKAIAGNLILPILDDQIAILDHAIETNSFLDQTKVAVRGWSFGGYLAILAVLLRPDRFHAAIGGAPVTDWRNYDTHYTERYLGNPDQNQFAYDACSAISIASRLTRPLLLIHGISDDNVFFAHTLQLSKALFEAGRPHNLLPITDITHMAESETAAENLLLSQLEFLKQKLGLEHMGG